MCVGGEGGRGRADSRKGVNKGGNDRKEVNLKVEGRRKDVVQWC